MTVAELPEFRRVDPAAVVLANLCRRSLSRFVREFWECVPGAGKLVWNWHMQCICDEIQFVMERVFADLPKLHDLVINVPFGTSKSSIASILFQPWTWTRMPGCRHITGTHTQGLVYDFAYKSREVMCSEKYRRCFPGLELVRDSSDVYSNRQGGERRSSTIGGKTPTGLHAHVLGIDDPIDPQGARSEAELETARKFVTEVIPSRVTDKLRMVMILIMQRLEYRDPTAVMLATAREDGATPVRHICLPGELSDKVSPPLEWLREKYGLEVYADGLLDPVRMPRVVLRAFRARLGAYGYAGQIMQEPTPPGGGMFKEGYFRQRVQSAPYSAKRVRAWDRAATADGGCYSAGVLMARGDDGRFYVEDCVHGQWEPNERNDRIVATAVKDRDRYGPKHTPLIVIEAERGSTGLESFQQIARRLAGFRVRESQPTGSKDSRAEPWSDQCAAMNVWLVENERTPWDIAGFVQEHCLFRPEPGKRLGKYKDQVDAAAMTFAFLVGKRPAGTMRIVPIGRAVNFRGPRLVVCNGADELRLAACDLPSLLVRFADPEVSTDSPSGTYNVPRVGESGVENVLYGAGPISPHGLDKLLGEVTLVFADLDPAERQDTWDETVPSLLMRPEHAKKLWSLVTRQRGQPAEVIVFADGGDGDRRALSAALAVADVLRLPRGKAMTLMGDTERAVGDKEVATNGHVYEVVKRGRSLVI